MAKEARETERRSALGAISGLLLLLSGLGTAISDLVESGGKVATLYVDNPVRLTLVLVAIVAGGIVLYIRRRDSLRSRLRDPNAFDLPLVPDRTAIYAEKVEHIEEFLVGRKDHSEELKKLIVESPLVFVVGSSGVGKSTLLKLGTARRLHQSGVWLPIYFDVWGADWIRGPYEALADAVQVAVQHGLADKEREALGLQGAVTRGNVFKTLGRLREVSGRRPAVIFDQVDDYQTQNRAKFVDPEDKAFLSSERVTAANEFWREIEARCSDQDNPLHCVFSIRGDQAIGLECFRFVEPRSYELKGLIPVDVDRLIANLTDEAKIDNPEGGFRQLKSQLARELKARGAAVLPIQVRVAVGGLAGLKTLTPQGLENAGGLPGLEAAYVEHYAPADDKQARALLQALVLEAGDGLKTDVKTIEQLHEQFPADSQLETTLERLERGQIVRRRLEPGAGEVWQLYHDYLAHGVVELERRQRRWEVFLDEAAAAFEEAQGLWAKWRKLLAPGTLFRLLWERLLGRLSFAQRARFARISSLRLAVNVWVPLVAVGALVWWQYDGDQRATRIVTSFDMQRSIADAETRALWSLSGESRLVKRRVLEKFLSDPRGPERLRAQPAQVLDSLGGLDRSQRLELLETAIRLCGQIASTDRTGVEACAHTLNAFDPTGQSAANLLISVMEAAQGGSDLARLPSFWGDIQKRLSPESADRAAGLIVTGMERGEFIGGRRPLMHIGGQLSNGAARQLEERIIRLMRKTREPRELRILGESLGDMGNHLSTDAASRAAERMLKIVETTSDQEFVPNSVEG